MGCFLEEYLVLLLFFAAICDNSLHIVRFYYYLPPGKDGQAPLLHLQPAHHLLPEPVPEPVVHHNFRTCLEERAASWRFEKAIIFRNIYFGNMSHVVRKFCLAICHSVFVQRSFRHKYTVLAAVSLTKSVGYIFVEWQHVRICGPRQQVFCLHLPQSTSTIYINIYIYINGNYKDPQG